MTWNYGDSERIDRMLRRREREKRVTFGCLGFAVLFVVALIWNSLAGRSRNTGRPPVPLVRVTWKVQPKLDSRVFTPLPIAGHRDSFLVAVLVKNKIRNFPDIDLEDAHRWTFSTAANDAMLFSTYTILCQPTGHGLGRLDSHYSPTYELRTEIIAPALRNGGLLALPAPVKSPAKSAYISADVEVADPAAQWDEGVVNFIQKLPAGLATTPWMVEPGFSGAPRSKGDFGTYFAAAKPETTDLQGQLDVARVLARAEPRATIKLIATEGEEDVTRVVFRVILDGRGSRDGWLRKKGEKKAKRLLWWLMPVSSKTREGKAVPKLPEPAPPRAAPKHKPTTEPTATPEVVSPSMPAMRMKLP